MTYDVIVAGGGPSGLIAAERIASKGRSVLVLEEHKEIGVPDHCAGLISTTGLHRLGLNPPSDVIQNTVRGARIFSASGHSLTIERGQREALVVSRSRFDQWLAKRAMSSGAEIRLESKVRSIISKDRGYLVEWNFLSQTHSELAKVVINAEGSRGQLSKQLGLSSVPRTSKLAAYQFEVSGVDVDSDHVEMFYGRRISKGFFAWVIPLGEGRARVGLASRDTAKKRLQHTMKAHPPMANKLEGLQIERGFGGIVLVGLPVRRTVNASAISIGDAAGMVKSTTGGGIIIGGLAAQIAADVISHALVRIKSHVRLNRYEKRWKARLFRELQTMFFAQKILTSFSDKGLDTIIEGANKYRLLDVIRSEGDMDMQRKVILRLLKNPRMILLGLQAIRYLNPFS